MNILRISKIVLHFRVRQFLTVYVHVEYIRYFVNCHVSMTGLMINKQSRKLRLTACSYLPEIRFDFEGFTPLVVTG